MVQTNSHVLGQVVTYLPSCDAYVNIKAGFSCLFFFYSFKVYFYAKI